jgi:SOS-response transcriptional repressor LexA
MRAVDKKAFGLRVARRREALHLSQTDLALATGMKQQGIDSIEKGQVGRPRLLREIAAALRTTDAWLLWAEGPIEPVPTPEDFTRIPLLAWVSAGKLADPGSEIPVEDVPLLAFADLGRGDFFALKVVGDSMDRVSPEGSTIVVNRTDRQLVAGKCYVFSVRGETTYKRWNPDPIYLAPFSTNPAHSPIFIKRKKDLEVVGRVRRTVLDL